MNVKRLLLVLSMLAAFGLGYGGTRVLAYPAGGIYGRAEFRGYFTNSLDSSGWEVLNASCSTSGEYGPYYYYNGNTYCNAIPRDLNTAAELKTFIEGRINNGVPNGSYGFGSGTYGDTRAKTGAAMIVHTMLNTPVASRSRPPSAQQLVQWRALVDKYAAAGLIRWSTDYNFTINSLYQATDNSPSPNDVAFYDEDNNHDGIPDVFDGYGILFLNPSGGVEYAIRRACGNPVSNGDPGPLPDFAITGQSVVNNPTPRPGDSIIFRHSLTNSGPQSTSPTSIGWTVHNMPPSGSGNSIASGSSIQAVGGPNTVYTEPALTVPFGTPVGTQYCRQIRWTPTSATNYGTTNGATVCATVQGSFSLSPIVTVRVNGATVSGNIVEPGDTVTFTYTVNNSASGDSSGTSCTALGQTFNSYHPAPTPPEVLSTPIPGMGCPRNFPGSARTDLTTETIPAASVVANRSICRSLSINPATPGGGSLGTEACAYVATKPYARVYGGDVMVGGGYETAPGVCTNNQDAAVIGWNKGASGSYGGSGVQYAVYALSAIFDTASALGSSGGASPPTGLSFGNTSADAANGLFGGSFGSAPCITNYYAGLPGSTLALPGTVGGMSDGAYSGTGDITLGGGTVNSNNHIDVYVDGDVFISGNITYGGSGSWTSASIPSFRLIVRGDIFIDNDVSQLDGLYVAQANGAAGGNIYTCALDFTPLALNGALASTCDNASLTINGGLVANRVHLSRTVGTLRQSSAAEGPSSTNIAEVINFGPSLWIPQPVDRSGPYKYDSITSLPPVL